MSKEYKPYQHQTHEVSSLQDVFELRYAKMPEEQTSAAFDLDSIGTNRDDGSSSSSSSDSEPDSENDDSEEEREKRLKELQEQVHQHFVQFKCFLEIKKVC